MCFKYLCKDCKQEKYDYCNEYINSGRSWCTITAENPWGAMLKKCETCETIRGVIHKLKVLVLREPYLVTEGMAGAPKKAAWELEEAEPIDYYGGDEEEEDAESDGYTKEERRRIRAEALDAVCKRFEAMKAHQGEEGAVGVLALENDSE